MKHFCGIIAHQNPAQLSNLILQLNREEIGFCIQLDARTKSNMLKHDSQIEQKTLKVDRKLYRAHFSLVQAAFDLMQESLKVPYDYFHLISGEDLLHCTAKEMDQIIEEQGASNFLNHYEVPVELGSQAVNGTPISNYQHFALQGGMGLLSARHFPKSNTVQFLNRKLGAYRTYWRLYHLLFKTKLPEAKLYVGSAWFSIKRELVEYFLEQRETELVKAFKSALFPDEMLFQTLAMNSPFAKELINSDLRYIQWSEHSPKRPKYLDEFSLDEIKRSNSLFSRKWQLNSAEEFDKLEELLHV